MSDDEYNVFYTVKSSLKVAEIKSSSDPRITTLLDNIDQASNFGLVKNQKYLTFIDSKSHLNGLRLSLENNRPLFTSNK